MHVVIPYTPHAGQLLLHNDTHRFKTIACGRRFGKTVFAVNEINKKAILDIGQYWYIAPTYKQAKLIAWEMFKFYTPKEVIKKLNESDLSIQLVNGSIIRLMGADNHESLRGVGLKGCVLDEFADIKRIVWSTIIRPMLSDTKGWAIFLGTPKGKINHLYEHFIRDVQFTDEDYRTVDNQRIEVDLDFKSFKFKTSDSPYIDASEIDKARKELAPQYFKQEYEASFEDYTGIIYKEFDTSKHCISMPEIKSWWNVFVGIDTGRYTAVSFLAMDDLGKAYVFDEIYDYDGLVGDICTMIKAKLAQWKVGRAVYIIDSASQVKREYEHNGITALDSHKEVDNQIAQVRNRLKNDTLLFNRERCPMHIVEHKGYIWDDKARIPQPVKENDHTCNSVQYILSTYLAAKSTDIEAKKTYQKSLEYATIKRSTNSIGRFS